MKPFVSKKPISLVLSIVGIPGLILITAGVVLDVILPDAFRLGFISIGVAAGTIQAWAIWKTITTHQAAVNLRDRDDQLERARDDLRRAHGALTQWMCLDVIERRRIEDQLIEASRLESVAVLAGGIAHDFNNILTAILGNVSLAKLYVPSDDKENDKLLKRLSNAEKATLRAQDLTRQLLTMASGGQPVKQLACIREVVQEAVDFSLRGSNVRYELAIEEGLWPAEMDTGQISQVIHNLMINADHAMPNGGVIRVNAENVRLHEDIDDDRPANLQALKSGPYIKITIQDSGTGIEAEHLKTIFDPYFSTKTQGHGLGLSSTLAIMSKHDGAVHAESEVGVGATFHLYLPASPARHVMTPPIAVSPIASGTGRILIMEDDETLHDVVGHTLGGLGYEVIFTHDGHEALSSYQQALETDDPFDAIVLDLTIPGGMGGRETLSKLLAIDPQVKAIVVSGYSNDPILVKFQQYGFCGGIAKPYRAEQLHHILHQVIQAPMQAATTSPGPHQY